MKRNLGSFAQQIHDDQHGQVAIITAALMVVLLAFAAFVTDIGFAYYSYQQLIATTDAAALAGGAAIPAATAQNTAYQYSGDAALGGSSTYNTRYNMNITGVVVTLGCISTTTYPNLGLPPCIAYGSQAAANAIRVKETATVPTFFAKVIGINSINISATATATAKGGAAKPYNIVMVLDSTASMGNTTDPTCTVPGIKGAPTPEQCAQYGVQQLLGELAPCQSTLSNCPTPTNGMVTNPVDPVALMTFPGLCSQTASGSTCPLTATKLSSPPVQSTYASDDYTSCTNPPISAYNNNPGYLILPYQSDFRPSDTAGISSSSHLVNAVGGGSCGMPGIQTPGGEGTFYAGIIDAAQSYLTQTTVTRTGVQSSDIQNIMIFLSDGNANATPTQLGGKASSYPSSNECQQAATRAGVAKAAGTKIYSVSYGPTNSGCPTDAAPYNSPCYTMQQIASTPSSEYFFSVPKSGSSTVCSGARSITTLNQVFTLIASDLTNARLIPNNVPFS